MKNLKKLLILMMVSLLSIGLVGCGNTKKSEKFSSEFIKTFLLEIDGVNATIALDTNNLKKYKNQYISELLSDEQIKEFLLTSAYFQYYIEDKYGKDWFEIGKIQVDKKGKEYTANYLINNEKTDISFKFIKEDGEFKAISSGKSIWIDGIGINEIVAEIHDKDKLKEVSTPLVQLTDNLYSFINNEGRGANYVRDMTSVDKVADTSRQVIPNLRKIKSAMESERAKKIIDWFIRSFELAADKKGVELMCYDNCGLTTFESNFKYLKEEAKIFDKYQIEFFDYKNQVFE